MRKKLFLRVFLFLLLFFIGKNALAADIFCATSKTNVVENQVFTVSVYTDTKGISINSIESVFSFSKDFISVESINNTGSIFSIWVQPPVFSNAIGTISFNGGVPTPGYFGNKGKVLDISFKAKKAGIAQISFASASIYANDGLGTDVVSSKRGISINITPYQGAGTEEKTIISDKLPPSPIITSSEMPDPEAWYSLNSATFAWKLPPKIITTQILFGFRPDSTPTVNYTPPIKEKKINDFSDGIRYLHVRFKNSAGWGKTAHRKIKIDNTAPTDIKMTSNKTEDDLMSLKIEAKDATSGIEKYKISIDGNFALETVAENNQAEAILPAVNKGDHEINITAYDRASNLSEEVFVVNFPEFKPPVITKYSESIVRGEKIEVLGSSYPNIDVRIWLQSEGNEPKNYIVKTLNDGTFSFTSDFIETVGLTSFWAEAMMSENVISPPSEKYFTTVNKPAYIKVSILTIRILVVTIPALLLLIIIIYIIYHAYHKLRKMRRRLLLDLEQTESEAHKIFRILKDDVKESITIFNNKEIQEKLTQDENNTINTLSKDVEEAEEYFAKRIKNIEEKDL
jgi:hypothetical protein